MMKKKNRNINIENISNSSGGQINISGGNIHQENYFIGNEYEANTDNIIQAFEHIYKQIDARKSSSAQEKADLKEDVKDVQNEMSKGKKADSDFIARRLRNIKRMAPDICDVVLAILVNPALGFAAIAKKIAEKVKASA